MDPLLLLALAGGAFLLLRGMWGSNRHLMRGGLLTGSGGIFVILLLAFLLFLLLGGNGIFHEAPLRPGY